MKCHKPIIANEPTHCACVHEMSIRQIQVEVTLYLGISQPLETGGPLRNFGSRSRTTTENCAIENCQNWSLCAFIFLKNKKIYFARGPPCRCSRTTSGPRTTS